MRFLFEELKTIIILITNRFYITLWYITRPITSLRSLVQIESSLKKESLVTLTLSFFNNLKFVDVS